MIIYEYQTKMLRIILNFLMFFSLLPNSTKIPVKYINVSENNQANQNASSHPRLESYQLFLDEFFCIIAIYHRLRLVAAHRGLSLHIQSQLSILGSTGLASALYLFHHVSFAYGKS